MDDLDLSALSLKELNALASKIDVQILTLQRRNLSEALSEIEILVSKRGLKMSTIIAALTGDSDLVKASVSTIKYIHPTDPTKTWTGHGRTPKWVKELDVKPIA